MYASIQVFEDDGKPLMHLPYIVPPTDIRSYPDVEIGKDKICVHYEFKFVMSRIEKDMCIKEE